MLLPPHSLRSPWCWLFLCGEPLPEVRNLPDHIRHCPSTSASQPARHLREEPPLSSIISQRTPAHPSCWLGELLRPPSARWLQYLIPVARHPFGISALLSPPSAAMVAAELHQASFEPENVREGARPLHAHRDGNLLESECEIICWNWNMTGQLFSSSTDKIIHLETPNACGRPRSLPMLCGLRLPAVPKRALALDAPCACTHLCRKPHTSSNTPRRIAPYSLPEPAGYVAEPADF